MAFDRDTFISLLTDYYEFCARTYWAPGSIAQPPDGSWPDISEQSLSGLQKNETVIDLIRRMPYPNAEGEDINNMPHMMNETWVVDYRRPDIQEYIRTGDEWYRFQAFEDDPLPPSCVCLALGSLSGYFVVLDTDDGLVYWGDVNGQHDEPPTELNMHVDVKGPDHWRADPGTNVYRPEEFFALCKQRFRERSWIGTEPTVVNSCRNFEWDEEHERLAEMLKRAGWPGDGEGRDWDRSRWESDLAG